MKRNKYDTNGNYALGWTEVYGWFIDCITEADQEPLDEYCEEVIGNIYETPVLLKEVRKKSMEG